MNNLAVKQQYRLILLCWILLLIQSYQTGRTTPKDFALNYPASQRPLHFSANWTNHSEAKKLILTHLILKLCEPTPSSINKPTPSADTKGLGGFHFENFISNQPAPFLNQRTFWSWNCSPSATCANFFLSKNFEKSNQRNQRHFFLSHNLFWEIRIVFSKR